MSARSTSSRSTSSFSTSVRSRSNGPWKTSRSRTMVAARICGWMLDGGSDAHRRAHVRQRPRRDRPRLVRAERQRPLDLGVVGPQLVVALAHRAQVLDDLLGHRALERPVAAAVELALDLLR